MTSPYKSNDRRPTGRISALKYLEVQTVKRHMFNESFHVKGIEYSKQKPLRPQRLRNGKIIRN